MPYTEASGNDSKTTNDRVASGYSLYAGDQDPLLQGILNLLTRMFGGGSGNLVNELGLMMQSITGVGNNTVSGAIAVRGATQFNGLPVSIDGRQTTLSGSGILATQANEAFRRQAMSSFTDPATGGLNRGAGSLNATELQQAIKYAMERGAQYSGGAMAEGASSTSGKVSFTAMRQNVDRLTPELQSMASVLSSIKDVLGGEHVANLERTLTALFGGGHKSMSAESMISRMAHIKSMAGAFFGGNMQEAVRYAQATQQAQASVIGGPGMSSAEASYKFGGISSLMATQTERLALASGQAAAANANIMMGITGQTLRVDNPTEVSDKNTKTKGEMAGQERELAVLEFQMNNTPGVTDDQRTQARALRERLATATTPTEIMNIRGEMGTLNRVISRGKSTEQIIKDNGGYDRILSDAGAQEGVNYVTARGSQRRKEAEYQNLMRRDKAFQNTFGMSADEAALFSSGVANLSVNDRQELASLMDAPFKQVGGVQDQFISQAGREALTARGIDPKKFAALAASKGSKDAAAWALRADKAQGIGRESEGQMRVVAEQEADEALKAMRGGMKPGDDPLNEFLQAAVGHERMSDSAIIQSAQNRKEEDLLSFKTAKDGNISASAGNYDTAVRALGAETMAKLGVKDAASFGSMLSDTDRRGRFYRVLKESGATSLAGDEFKFLGKKKADALNSTVSSKKLSEAVGFLLSGINTDDAKKSRENALGLLATEGLTDKSKQALSGFMTTVGEKDGGVKDLVENAAVVTGSKGGVKDQDAAALAFMVDNDMLPSSVKSKMGKQITESRKSRQAEIDKLMADQKDAGLNDEQVKKLGTLTSERDYLADLETRFDKGRKEASFGNVTVNNITVQGNIDQAKPK